MMLYQQGASIKPDGLTDEADALITAACEAKRLLLAKRQPADWCTAYTGPDDELDRAVYCDRQAGHPGNHRGAVGDGSETAWPGAEAADDVYRLTPAGEQAADAANPPHNATYTSEPHCEALDGNWVCTAQAGHDGPEHIAYLVGGNHHRWLVAKPLVISDSTIAQAAYFAQPGNTIDDILAEQAKDTSVTA